MAIPCNPIDAIIDAFGADKVAEITGRSQRMLRRGDGRFEVATRVADGAKSFKNVNNAERRSFMEGTKRICIMSSAGSAGISLHA